MTLRYVVNQNRPATTGIIHSIALCHSSRRSSRAVARSRPRLAEAGPPEVRSRARPGGRCVDGGHDLAAASTAL